MNALRAISMNMNSELRLLSLNDVHFQSSIKFYGESVCVQSHQILFEKFGFFRQLLPSLHILRCFFRDTKPCSFVFDEGNILIQSMRQKRLSPGKKKNDPFDHLYRELIKPYSYVFKLS